MYKCLGFGEFSFIDEEIYKWDLFVNDYTLKN
jgi:hypothetical protein